MVGGFALVLLAGFLQGTFVVPMALTRKWRWEHTWITFSVLGMLLFNWLIAWAMMPGVIGAVLSAPGATIGVLVIFGLGWGVGAILFGLGMQRLGMALGYPIIMGLIACLGSLIPLIVFLPGQLLTLKGCFLLAATAIAVGGVALCSVGGLRKQPESKERAPRKGFAGSLLIGILAGVLSCLPNVGVAFGGPLIDAVTAAGMVPQTAPSAVFALFFTAGGIVNCVYCASLMWLRRGLNGGYFGKETRRNVGLAAVMAALWIGSFHLYGVGSRLLGRWGLVAGWPLFICVSIGAGVLWGLWRGEWRGSPARARQPRNLGLAMLFVAILVISMAGSF